jgi:Flp pilus assembly pilin Flp
MDPASRRGTAQIEYILIAILISTGVFVAAAAIGGSLDSVLTTLAGVFTG